MWFNSVLRGDDSHIEAGTVRRFAARSSCFFTGRFIVSASSLRVEGLGIRLSRAVYSRLVVREAARSHSLQAPAVLRLALCPRWGMGPTSRI